MPAWIPPSGVPLVFAIMTVLQVAVAVLVVVRYGPAHLSFKTKTTATAMVEPGS